MTSSADPNVALAARIFSDGAPYSVKLPVFEGPLDLLLHLIRLNEVEITDIPIARVGEQYLEYLELMRELNLDVAGEYLLMAATLAWIKSRMLLPPDGAEDDELVDPRAELVARLLEYQRFKEVADDLGERRLLGRDVFEARGAEPDPVPAADREVEVGLFELMEAMRHVLSQSTHTGAVHEIEVETITVHERMIAVMEVLETREAAEFIEVLSARNGEIPSRTLVITTFLAILELTRLAALRIYQGIDESGAPVGPIRLRRVEDGDVKNWTERISDLM